MILIPILPPRHYHDTINAVNNSQEPSGSGNLIVTVILISLLAMILVSILYEVIQEWRNK